MGNPKQKWTAEEEEALRAGVAKHGAGKWKLIQRDAEFNHLLSARSNIDLKDKWRNLGVANGQAPREKSKAPKPKANPGETSDTPQPVLPTPAPASVTPLSQGQDAVTNAAMVGLKKHVPEGINAAMYNTMIYEALSSLQGPNGSDFAVIADFIQRRHAMPPNFKRQLGARLKTLVEQGKLEKVQKCYKIKGDAVQYTKIPAARPIELQPRPVPDIGTLGSTVEEASIFAALKVAEAESKEFVAAESVKEAERIATMAEDSETLLQFVTFCFDQSAYGKIMLMA